MLATLCLALLLGTCPEPGELPTDCPWAGFARRLSEEADRGRDIGPLFDRLAPELTRQMRADAQNPQWLRLWTDATNADDDSRERLVHPALLEVLSARMGVDRLDQRRGAVHAGLQQTYGALFSLVANDRGFRRRRWVDGELEAALGIAEPILRPLPRSGTLFRNVTYIIGRIGLADADERHVLESAEVPAVLRELRFEEWEVRRLEERVFVPRVSGREIVLRTDAVALPNPTEQTAYLVVYSWFDPSEPSTRLLAGVPASSNDVTALFASDHLGEDRLVSSRFDGYIDGLTGELEPLSGSRRIISLRVPQ